MDISEKLLQLRKAGSLTQEQLAEKLDVSRQSVSKWESGQAVPEPDKIVALSELFHVSTDTLLKSSELDELSMKTRMLEKSQREIASEQKKLKAKQSCILTCIAIYLTAFVLVFFLHIASWQIEFLWDLFPGFTLHIIGFLLATAASVFACRKQYRVE